MLNLLKLVFQHILPKLWLTRLIGWSARRQVGWLTNLFIDLFVRYHEIDMKEAQKSDIASYRTFNDFFVRQLRNDARPINTDPDILVMPVDGIISQLGKIEEDKILQAKGYNYSLESLLAGNYMIADQFRNGTFITIYLSPRDCHRVYMPCDGILREMIYVPGSLFSVNQLTIQHIPNLLSRNERVICLFDTDFGPMVQVLIGAIIVGSIETIWTGIIMPPREGIIKRWTWPSGKNEHSVSLRKGQEMGRFNLGSTVINLFVPNKVKLVTTLEKLSITRIGQPMAISDVASIASIEEEF